MSVVEITREAFQAVIKSHVLAHEVIRQEHATIFVYENMGVQCKQVDNYLSRTTQYFVCDINS